MEIGLTHRHLLLAALLAVPVGLVATQAVPQPAQARGHQAGRGRPAAPADPMLARFAKVSPANISDAIDQVGGERGYLVARHAAVHRRLGSWRAATSLLRACRESVDRRQPPRNTPSR